MIDITNLTSLITAFRNETEQGSISPETLGALLQAIANELKKASTETDQNSKIARLQSLVDDLNTSLTNIQGALGATIQNYDSRFIELNDYLESMDGVVQENADNINSLSSSVTNLGSRVSAVPILRGTIVIDDTSITSPVTTYFKYNMPDGYYELVRANKLIGHVVTYMYNNFRVFNIVGLCHINTNSFVYHDSPEHILVRVNSSGQIFVTGTIDSTYLQNQINEKQDKLTAGIGIKIENNVISIAQS